MGRLSCPHCGAPLDRWDQPRLTVDALVLDDAGRVLLVERGHPPFGWALPGGFVDAGETLETAVARELAEETGLVAESVRLFGVYSDPARDPRHHTVTAVYRVRARGTPAAGDDARTAAFLPFPDPGVALAFDHARILADAARAFSGGASGDVLD